MAIQMRRGLKRDFDPTKMLAGEWAVCIDNDTGNQIVYMCFGSTTKRMGTYEDFQAMIREATSDIRQEYIDEFNGILSQDRADRETYLAEMQTLLDNMTLLDNEVVTVRNDVINTYLPRIIEYMNTTKGYRDNALASMNSANAWADTSKSYATGTADVFRQGDSTDNSKYYSEQSHSEAERSKSFANTAQSLLDEAMKKVESVTFTVNTTTGNLEYTSSAYIFTVNTTTGNLEYTLL